MKIRAAAVAAPDAKSRRRDRRLSTGVLIEAMEMRRHLSVGTPHDGVRLNTNFGRITVELFDETPLSKANFLAYVNAGKYNNTVVHRSVPLSDGDGFAIIQAGGYSTADGFPHIATFGQFTPGASTTLTIASTGVNAGTITRSDGSFDDEKFVAGQYFFIQDFSQSGNASLNGGLKAKIDAVTPATLTISQVTIDGSPAQLTAETLSNFSSLLISAGVPNEFSASRPDALGTIAMARTTDKDSASSEFFINTSDNSNVFGASNGGGYAVFGDLLGAGLNIATQINNLSKKNLGGAFTDFPQVNNFVVTVDSAVQVVTQTVTVGGSDADQAVTWLDENGASVRFTIKGGGTADLTFSGEALVATSVNGVIVIKGRNVNLDETNVRNDTTSKTIITYNSKGQMFLGSITAAGSLAQINAPRGHLNGDLTVAGSLNRLNLLASDGVDIKIGSGTGGTLVANIRDATDTNVDSAIPISNLNVKHWVDNTSGSTHLTLKSNGLGRVNLAGNFGSDVTSTGAIGSFTLGSYSVRNNQGTLNTFGAVTRGTWTITGGDVGSITIKGGDLGLNSPLIIGAGANSIGSIRAKNVFAEIVAKNIGSVNAIGNDNNTGYVYSGNMILSGSLGSIRTTQAILGETIRTAGNIGSISTMAILPRNGAATRIYAGVKPSVNGVPATILDFADVSVTIDRVTVKRNPQSSFQDTIVAAPIIKRVDLGTVATDNSNEQQGVVADTIGSLTALLDTKKTINLRDVTDQAAVDAYFSTHAIVADDLNDLKIVLV